jgi:hypothetical protein
MQGYDDAVIKSACENRLLAEVNPAIMEYE